MHTARMFGKSQPLGIRKYTSLAGAGFLGIFGLPFLAMGLFITYIYFSGYANWWKARQWEEIPCTITSVDLKASSNRKSSGQIKATYRYHYQGRGYQSDRVDFNKGSDNVGRERQREDFRKLSASLASKTQDSYRCYVDPTNPASSVLDRDLRWSMQGFLALFVLIFPAIGASLVVGGFLGVITARREWKLREAHPAKPWKWKANWADTTIPANGAGAVVFFCAYTLWFWLVIGPLAASVLIARVYEYDTKAGIVGVPVILGAVLTWFSIRRFRSRKALGKCRFELKQWPASQGAAMQGDILIERLPPAGGDATVTLSCLQSTTRGSGKNSSTTVEKIWSHQEAVPLNRIFHGPAGQRLPVRFSLPEDAPDSSLDPVGGVKNNWQLDLRLPGSFPLIRFDIPVFQQAGETTPRIPKEAATKSVMETSVSELPARLAANRLIVDFAPSGFPRSIVCPPSRHLRTILFLILFDVIWTTVAVFLFAKEAPLLFRVVWSVSATAIWLSVIWMALHKRSVTFDGDGLVVSNRFGPIVWTHSYQKREILGFKHDTNMTSGNQQLYRIRLESVIGKKETLVDAITESNTAAALAGLLDQWKTTQA